MPQGTKIATCCYCGTRAALVLRGKERHELSCASCGAPLHEMKMLRVEDVSPRQIETRPPPRKPDRTGVTPLPVWERPAHPKTRGKKKKRKGFARRFLEEVFDEIEDLFD